MIPEVAGIRDFTALLLKKGDFVLISIMIESLIFARKFNCG